MKTPVSKFWNFRGWEESVPISDVYLTQYDWNSSLLTTIDDLSKKLEIKSDNSDINYNAIKLNSKIHDYIIHNALFYRIKKHKRYIGKYRIIIDDNLENNEIILFDKYQPEALKGLIIIEKLH